MSNIFLPLCIMQSDFCSNQCHYSINAGLSRILIDAQYFRFQSPYAMHHSEIKNKCTKNKKNAIINQNFKCAFEFFFFFHHQSSYTKTPSSHLHLLTLNTKPRRFSNCYQPANVFIIFPFSLTTSMTFTCCN